MLATRTRPTAEDYQRAFDAESAVSYPMVDEVEAECGFAVDRAKLLAAAAVLACPVKANPPNWQHGRVLYALARSYLSAASLTSAVPMCFLDIGTAKGFSALCMEWALDDAGAPGRVHSVDVIHPDERAWRNTVLEVGAEVPPTLREVLAGWPEAEDIKFHGMTGIQWFMGRSPNRVNFAFVDGKHAGTVVRQEAQLLASRQEPGDVAVFDDVHIPDVRKAAMDATRYYHQRIVQVLPNRAYLICKKN